MKWTVPVVQIKLYNIKLTIYTACWEDTNYLTIYILYIDGSIKSL